MMLSLMNCRGEKKKKKGYLSRRVCNSANQQMNPVNKVITVHLEQPNGVGVGGGGEESFKWM